MARLLAVFVDGSRTKYLVKSPPGYQSNRNDYADHIEPSSSSESPLTRVRADSSSRPHLFGGEQGHFKDVGHQSKHCRLRGSSCIGLPFAMALPSTTYHHGRRTELPVRDRYSIQLYSVL